MTSGSYVFRKKNTKWCDADTAVRNIRKGGRILVGSGGAEPQRLVAALVKNAAHFRDNEIAHLLTLGIAPYTDPQYSAAFRHNAFFIGPNVREAVCQGMADYTPVFLSDIPGLFKSGQMPIHCAIIQVGRPDLQGMVSLGISVDILPSAIASADIVIAQMNKFMPETYGESKIPLSCIDYVVEADEPLAGLALQYPDDTSIQLAEQIKRYVRDGDTLQIGIGSLPNAILKSLNNKNDLGIHSEVVSDEIIELYRNGNITNLKKGINEGVSVVSFVMGTRDLYGFVGLNPDFRFMPSEYVNNPCVIAQNKNMVSINSALQIDLTGQVCADSIGCKFYSGFGGQVDFIRGARMSDGGRSFIALPSTAQNGTVSRIVATLNEGAGVVTSRADVDYVATEYGVAYLHGKTIRERGLALTQIAHPNFRDELLDGLKQRHYVYLDQKTVKDDGSPAKALIPYSSQFKDRLLYFRPLAPCDEKALQDFFYSHAPETVYARYLKEVDALPHAEALERVSVDYTKDMALAGFDSPEPYGQMVCVGRYLSSGDAAEMALVVREDFQQNGIGRFLVSTLIKAAHKHGLKKITASIGRTNLSMLNIVRNSGFTVENSSCVDGYEACLVLSPDMAMKE